MRPTLPTDRTAADIMTERPRCIRRGMSVREVAQVLDEANISGAPVVDAANRLVGVVSRTDLVKRYTSGVSGDPSMLVELFAPAAARSAPTPRAELLVTVDDFMSTQPVTAEPSTSLRDLARRMVDSRVHRVIIVNQDRLPVGIVTSLDLVNALAGL